ncbi:hypothetical protein [Gracilimonas mengyeensis]|uniref:Uncharacterized protein n=1 Tax=Gracilimonas mengyeensis TaxID=1302730 RepID=A0A521D513_9BACT|nr:hypothetical protein [Gracilimonas mengyeensis]SMO66793.1 hypothetical protein SAMN06265219_107126 [Gracilimonas mengyeensis]
MLKYIVLCIMVIAGYLVYINYPVSHGPGKVAKEAPKIESARWEKPFEFKGATLTPKKKIAAKVRVIKKEPYYFDDFTEFSPMDVLVGWNELSDERNLEFIYFSLQDRSYEVELTRPPLEVSTIHRESDLWHLIPSSSKIKDQIKEIRNGHVISISGMLVDIDTSGEFNFTTDTEITPRQNENGFGIWVEEMSIR